MSDINIEAVQKNNEAWWEKHSPETPFTTVTGIDVSGKDFPLGPRQNPYGRFIYCPMPVNGETRWGFELKASLDRFLADVKAGTLPVVSRLAPPPPRPVAPVSRPAPLEDDPFDLLGGDPTDRAAANAGKPPPVVTVIDTPAKVDAVVAESLAKKADLAPVVTGGAPETDEWGEVINPAPADDEGFDIL